MSLKGLRRHRPGSKLDADSHPVLKDLDDFVFTKTTVDEGQVRELANGEFLDAKRNVILVGGTGTGKTHLAIAIAAAVIPARAWAQRRTLPS
jgi:DNA replication protein DnaC